MGALGAIQEAAVSTIPLIEMEIIVRTHTMINCHANMIPHGGYLNIVAAVGAFDGGQKAHFGGGHPESITIAGTAGRSSRDSLGGLSPKGAGDVVQKRFE